MVPCVQVKSEKDKKGIKKLSKLIEAIPAERGIRVMTVGLKKPPKTRGVVFESFDDVNEAILWLQANTPHGAILAGSNGEYSLLEYDLIERQIPVQKTKTNKQKAGDVLQWLQSL